MVALAGALAACIALSGCLGTAPEPTPTPTAAFASEEEAFAAAEETYRAYIGALNARREDPLSVPDPYTFLVGEALENDLALERELEAQGLRAVGDGLVDRVDPTSADPELGDVAIEVCLNATQVRILNSSGEDVTPPDRPDFTRLTVQLTTVGDALVIERSEVTAVGQC